MKKVFVVTSGDYSDYGIDAIYTTRELAQIFIDAFNKDTYRQMEIEEWDLDPNEQHLKQGRKPFFLRIDKEGNIRDVEQKEDAYGFKANMPNAAISYTHDLTWLNIECFADDETHAVKIAGEKRTQILAADKWGIR